MATENGAARFANAQECRSPGNHAVSNPVHQRVPIKGETYFRNPTLLALVAPPSTKRFLWSVPGVSPANAKYRFHSSACSANPVPNPTLPANRAPPWRIRSGPRAAAEWRPLVQQSARLDLQDTQFHSTPQDWAIHAGHTHVAGYLSAPGGTPPASHKVKPR